MKILLLPLFFYTVCLNGMSPADIIKTHIEELQSIPALLEQFDSRKLVAYRDINDNNLFHITMQSLLRVKNEVPDYPQLLKNSEVLMRYLSAKGVRINTVNNRREAPIFDLYRDEDKRNQPLEEFLERELHAHPTYFSFEPEM